MGIWMGSLWKVRKFNENAKCKNIKSEFYSTMNATNKADGVHYTQQTALFHARVLQSKHNSFKNVTD
jgi:hypothetical protein